MLTQNNEVHAIGTLPRLVGISLVIACAGSPAHAAFAWKLICQDVDDGGHLEPLGDRDGHAISVGEYVCRAEGGPLDGAVFTGNTVWGWNGTSAEIRAGGGVYRKDGAMAAHDKGEGKLSLTLVDGKVTGWSAASRGTYNVAVGSAAPLLGKTWNAVAHPTGSHQFTIDIKVE